MNKSKDKKLEDTSKIVFDLNGLIKERSVSADQNILESVCVCVLVFVTSLRPV